MSYTTYNPNAPIVSSQVMVNVPTVSTLDDIKPKFVLYSSNQKNAYPVPGTPPYYVTSTYTAGGFWIVYICSSNVMEHHARFFTLPSKHTIFSFDDQSVKMSDLRTVLEAAALRFPERFTPRDSNGVADANRIISTIASVIRIGSQLLPLVL